MLVKSGFDIMMTGLNDKNTPYDEEVIIMVLFVVFVLCMTALLITFCLGALYISKKYGK